MAEKVYKIGSIKMSHQAFLIVIVGSAISALVFIAGLITGHKHAIIASTVSALGTLGLTFWQAYVVNCTTVGSCNNVAWFLTIMYIILTVSSALGVMMLPIMAAKSAVSGPMSYIKSKSSKSFKSLKSKVRGKK